VTEDGIINMKTRKHSHLSNERLKKDIMTLEDRARVLQMRIAEPKGFPTDDPVVDAISLKHLRCTLDEMYEELKQRQKPRVD